MDDVHQHGYIILNLRGKSITKRGWLKKQNAVFKQKKSTKKVLYAIFFRNEGHVLQVAIPKDR